MHVYDVRPRKDKRGVDLISDALPFGALWYGFTDRARITLTDGKMSGPDVIDARRKIFLSIDAAIRYDS
jgi:hypothetical protein